MPNNDLIFVSYSHRDHDRVLGIIEQVRGRGLNVWIDLEGISGASLWAEEIVKAIRSCGLFILMLSRHSICSEHVGRELALAAEARRPLLPIFLEQVEPPPAMAYALAGIQHLEMLQQNSEEEMSIVLRSISQVLKVDPVTPSGSGKLLFDSDDQTVAATLGEPPPEARVDRMTLRLTEGALTHLICRPSVQLGRNRACDIVTRLMDEAGTADETRNEKLSRFHCVIENNAGSCRLVDRGGHPEGGDRKPSAHGVFVNDVRVPSGSAVQLPDGERIAICLGGADPADDGVFQFTGHLWSCRHFGGCGAELHEPCRQDESACLTLRHRNTVTESFVLLWRHASLDVLGLRGLYPAPGGSVARFRGAFAIYPGLGSADTWRWLVPGQRYGGHEDTAVAEPFTQFGNWA